MSLITIICLIVFGFIIYLVLINKTSPSKPPSSSQSKAQGLTQLIPKGYQIFQDFLVAGVSFRKLEALQFAHGSDQEVEFERDPTNTHDKNAIKVIGKASGRKYFIGYVPKEVSAEVISSGVLESVRPRLFRIYEGLDDYLEINVQMLVPKVEKKKIDAILEKRPAETEQKDFYKFFGFPEPKGLTIGDAAKFIKEQTKELESIDPAKLKEYNAYQQILSDFDDGDFRDSYDLKKVSKTILIKSMDQLRAEGKTYENLAENIDDLVNKILEQNPDLMKVT